MAGEDLSLNIGLKLDDSALKNLQRQLNSGNFIDPIEVKAEIDKKSIKSIQGQIKSIKNVFEDLGGTDVNVFDKDITSLKGLAESLKQFGLSDYSISRITEGFEQMYVAIKKCQAIPTKDGGVLLNYVATNGDDIIKAATKFGVAGNIISTTVKSIDVGADAAAGVKKTFSELISKTKEWGTVRATLAKTDETSADFDRLSTRCKTLASDIDDLYASLGGKNMPEDMFKEYYNVLSQVDAKVKSVGNHMQDISVKKQLAEDARQAKVDFNELLTAVKRYGDAYKNIIKYQNDKPELANEYLKDFNKYAEEADRLYAKLGGENMPTAMFDKYNAAMDEAIGKSDKMQAELNDIAVSNRMNEQAKEIDANVTKLASTIKEINSVEMDLFKTDKDSAEAKTLIAKLEKLKQVKGELETSLSGKDLSDSQIEKISQATEKAASNMQILKDKVEDAKSELAKNVELDFENGNLNKQLANIRSRFTDLRNPTDELIASYREFEYAQQQVANELIKEEKNIDDIVAAYERYEAAVKKVGNQISVAKIAQDDDDAKNRLELNKSNFLNKIVIWETQNSAAVKGTSNAVKDFKARIEGIKEAVANADSAKLSNLQTQFNTVTKEVQIAGKTGLSWGDALWKKIKQYSSYFTTAFSFMEVIQGLRNMYQAVLEVDTAMTELKRVTDLSANQYTDLYSELTVSAREYGTTLADIISATADWSRAGFDANIAKGLAEVTTMYEHIADVDYDTAVQNLLTAYKGFQSQLDEQFGADTVAAVSYIGDILNELDNEYSVTADGIGEALKRSASALDIAGNSIQETAAMVTGITEVTQDPEKAGNALKVLSMRLRGMKGGLEELGEEVDDNVTSLSKMQGQVLNLTHGKVDIFDSAGEFKSTYEIMQGIADVWEDLSSIEQADLLETIAGKHRANDVAALIQNWNDVEKAVVSATDAEGSAAREHEKYMDSIQGKLNALTSVFQTFSNTVMSSDLIKFAVDALKSLLDIIEKIISTIGGIGTAGIFTGIGLVIRNIVKGGNIATFFKAIKGGVNSLKDFGAAAKIAGEGFKAFLSTPAGIATGIGIVATLISGVYSAIQSINEANRKARQEVIDTSNTFSDAYGSFEQLYIQYSGKSVLTTDEENELKNAIDGTINALGDKSAALRDAAGASSEYVNNLDKVADAELKQAQQLAQDAKVKAKEQLTDWWSGDAGQYQLFSWKDSKADFKLPGKSNKNYKVVEDIVNDPSFQKWLSKQHTRKAYIGPGDDDYIAQFDRNANFDELVEYYNYARKTKQAFEDVASETKDDSYLEDESYKSAAEAVESMSSGMETLVQQTYNEAKAGYQLQNGIVTTEKAFFKMRESILSSAADTVEARDMIGDVLNKEYGDIFDLSSVESQIDYIKSVTNGVEDIDIGNDKLTAFETFLDLKTSLNGGECTVGEYISQMDKVNEIINGIEDKATQDFLRVQLGLELDADGNIDDKIKKWRDNLVNNMTRSGVEKDIANKLADGLNAQELEAAVDLVAEEKIDLKNVDIDDFKKQIEQRAELNKALRFSIDIETETQGIEAFNTALSETRSAMGLSSDSMEKLRSRYNVLKGYDAAKLFEETATGVRLNTEEVNKLEQSYANANIKDIDNNLKVLKDEYDELGVKIQNCSDINERAELYAEREDVRAKINELAELGAAYEGLTNAYAQWQNAESAGNNRDMYANVQSAMETVKEELDLGWVDDGTKEYFDLIWGDNWNSAGKGIEDYRAKWATLDDTIDGTTYSIQDFFKVDEDGNLKASGINNFFDAVRQKQEELGKNWVEFDKDGNLITIDLGVDGEQAIADALGISEELVDIFMQASKDAGFVVTIDGKYTKLADLQNRAEEAAKTLKNLGKTDFDFDFDTTSLESVQEQLVEAENVLDKFRNKDHTIKAEFIKSDGTFTEDAQAAIDVMSTLTAMADKLAEPKYMQLETNQVEDSLQEPLKDIQKFEELCQTKHQYEITGKGTKELDEQMQDIVTSLNELPEETKVDLGIDGLTPEQIQEKLEAGEITIDATVDIQMEMSDDLKDIRALLMHQAGLISDEELTLMIDFDFDTSKLNELTDEEKSVLVDFVPDTTDIDNYTPKQLQTVVKFIKDVDDIDSYTPEQKSVVAEFVADTEGIDDYSPQNKKAIVEFIKDADDIDSYTPEEKQAIAKYAVDGGDVDSYSPEDRNAIVKFLTNSADPDSYTPEQREAIVRFDKDSSEPDNYKVPTKTGTAKYSVDTSSVNSYKVPTKYGKIIYNIIQNGSAAGKAALQNRFGISNGTAYVNGTAGRAFKQGDWGTKTSGKALVGELGQELLVRDGHYYTIGDNGAEFIDYKKGDIIFNAGQTRQLFEQGKIVNGQTRGRAYVSGTAFDLGNVVSGIPHSEGGIIDLFDISDQLNINVGVNLDTSSIEAQLINYEKYGNVNLLVRPRIDAQYLKDAGWYDVGDGAATVFTSTYTNEDGTVAVNFTPIVVDENGKFTGVLSPDELQEYAEGVIAGTRTDDLNLQIGAEFNGENAIEDAENAAQSIHELHEVYYADAPVIPYASSDSEKPANTPIKDNVDFTYSSESNWLSDLNGYINESASSTGLLAESMDAIINRYKDLEGYDPSTLFQRCANGIQLNIDAVKKYERQIAKANLDKINKDIKSQKREYYANAKAIATCADAEKKEESIGYQNYLKDKIKANEALAASYDGLISKYNQWITASSETKQREPYDNINSEYDTVMDLLDRGWVGDEEVTSFLDLIFGDNYSTIGKRADQVADDLRNALKQNIEGTYFSIGDFFTYDDNGNTTADGYFNMLDAIMQKQEELGKNWVQKNENGEYTFDFGVTGLDEIAEAFGVSKDLIALILQAGRDAGHTVNFDGVIGDIDNLQEKATNAVNTLHEMGATDYQFNLDTNDTDSLNEQLTVAQGLVDQFRNEDGTINIDAPGAQEAVDLLTYIQTQIDLINSHYIGIKTDDTSLQEPLEKLQDYEIYAAQLNSLKINPQVNADEITNVEQKMQEIVDYIAGLDSETLGKLGFNFDGLSPEEIQNQIREAISNGTVTIPAKVDVENADTSSTTDDSSVNTTVNVNTVDPDGSLNFLKEYGEKGLELQARLTAEDADPEVIDDCRWLVDTFGDAGLDLALALTDGTNGQNFGAIMGIVQTYGDKGLNLALALTDGTNGQHFGELMGLVNTYGDKGLDIALALTDGQNEQHYGEIMGLINTYGDTGLDVALALTDGVNEENYGKIMGLINDYGDRAFQFAIAITNDEEGTNTNLLDEIIKLSEEHGGEALDIGYALADKTEAEQAKWLDFIESHPNDFEVTYHAIVTGDTVLLKKIIGEDNSGNALELDADEQNAVEQDGKSAGTAVGTQRVHADNNGSYEYQQPEHDINGVDIIVGGVDTSVAQAVSDQVNEIPSALASVPGRLGEALSGAQETIDGAISNAGEELASVPERFGNALSEAWNNSVVGKWFNDTFGVKTANASEASDRKEISSTTSANGSVRGGFSGGTGNSSSQNEDSRNGSGGSGGRSRFKNSSSKETTQIEAEVTTVDVSHAPEAEIDSKAEVDKVDTSSAPDEEVSVTGEVTNVEQKSPFQIAVDDSGIKDAMQDGEALKSTLLGLNDSDVLAIGNMMLPGLSEAVTDANQMRDIISGISPDGLVNIFTNTGIESALVDAETFNAYLDTLTSEQRQVVLDLVTPEGSEEQTVNAEIQADDSDVVAKTSEQRTVPASINLNTAVMDSYLGTTKHSTVALDPYLIKKSFTGTIALTTTSVSGTGNVKVNGTANANGTAYVNGTVGKAFKHGNWGTKESGTALVGELGQEMVVRDGHFFTVGDNGAEFFNYKKGDIVFNAGQTKQLFEQGKIVNGQTRGRAYVNGTAFVNGGGVGRPHKTTTSGSRGNYTGSGSGSGSNYDSGGDSDASDEADEFEETLDWIETKIDRIERAISKLDTTASSVYKNWGTRNEALVNQIGKVGEEINLQQQAYDRYIKQADSVGLSEDYASKVRDGTIDIETITDEDLNDKISDYKEW